MPKKVKDDSAVKGLMTVLQLVEYKGGSILIRKFPQDMYVWDVFFNGKFYSSYIIMKPVDSKTELNDEELKEVVKMLYAGAAATIDYQLGTKLDKSQSEMVKIFEGARKTVTGKD